MFYFAIVAFWLSRFVSIVHWGISIFEVWLWFIIWKSSKTGTLIVNHPSQKPNGFKSSPAEYSMQSSEQRTAIFSFNQYSLTVQLIWSATEKGNWAIRRSALCWQIVTGSRAPNVSSFLRSIAWNIYHQPHHFSTKSNSAALSPISHRCLQYTHCILWAHWSVAMRGTLLLLTNSLWLWHRPMLAIKKPLMQISPQVIHKKQRAPWPGPCQLNPCTLLLLLRPPFTSWKTCKLSLDPFTCPQHKQIPINPRQQS